MHKLCEKDESKKMSFTIAMWSFLIQFAFYQFNYYLEFYYLDDRVQDIILHSFLSILEIKTFGLGSTIRDVSSEICSNIAYVTSGNGAHWDIGLVFESMNNFKTKSDTKLITLSCKFLIFKTKKDLILVGFFLIQRYHARHLQQIH